MHFNRPAVSTLYALVTSHFLCVQIFSFFPSPVQPTAFDIRMLGANAR
jgi:hypothetical protein